MVHATPPPPQVRVVQRPVSVGGQFVRWDSFLCSGRGCRLVVRTVPSAITPPVASTSAPRSFSSQLPSSTAPAVPLVDLAKGHRVAALTVIISPTLSRTAVELHGRVVAWDVRHHEGTRIWTVRVRVTPLDGTVYRVVRRGGRVAIAPPMGLAPGQQFATRSW